MLFIVIMLSICYLLVEYKVSKYFVIMSFMCYVCVMLFIVMLFMYYLLVEC